MAFAGWRACVHSVLLRTSMLAVMSFAAFWMRQLNLKTNCHGTCRCAGTCQFSGGGCVIKLSEPILKLRPPEDLKETLLHEMIHAFVFLLRLPGAGADGHSGPFKERMKRINESTAPDFQRPAAGYKITVFHTMHDEVNHYRVHWWQCSKYARPARKPCTRCLHRICPRLNGTYRVCAAAASCGSSNSTTPREQQVAMTRV